MVNNRLIRPYFLGGRWHGGVPSGNDGLSRYLPLVAGNIEAIASLHAFRHRGGKLSFFITPLSEELESFSHY